MNTTSRSYRKFNGVFALDYRFDYNGETSDPARFYYYGIFQHSDAIGTFIQCMKRYKQYSASITTEKTLNFAKALDTDIKSAASPEYSSANKEHLLWHFFCHSVQNCRIESFDQRRHLKHFQLLSCIYSKDVTCLDLSGLTSEKYGYLFEREVNRFIQDMLLYNPGIIKIIPENYTSPKSCMFLEERTKALLAHNQLVNEMLPIAHNPNLEGWIALFFDADRYHPRAPHILADLKKRNLIPETAASVLQEVPILSRSTFFRNGCLIQQADTLFKTIQRKFWGHFHIVDPGTSKQARMYQHVKNYFNNAQYLTRHLAAAHNFRTIRDELFYHSAWFKSTASAQMIKEVETTVEDYLDGLTLVAKRLPPMTKDQKEKAIKATSELLLANTHGDYSDGPAILMSNDRMKQDLRAMCNNAFSFIPDANEQENELTPTVKV